jgi:DNA-binding response OmpR family regulator
MAETTSNEVLIVDDERHMRDFLEIGLTQAGFRTRCAADGPAALSELSARIPNLVVLDVMLPKIDGIALLPLIRRATEVPILMLSAKHDVATRVAGLEAGADDYLAKPFEFVELIARVQTLLRRPKLARVSTLRFLDIEMDLEKRLVWRDSEEIALSSREFDLLAVLLRHPERVFTRQQLLDRVWGADRDVLPGSVETYISYLRAKLDCGPRRRVIRTIRGVGYSVR